MRSTFNEEIDMKQLFGILVMALVVSVAGCADKEDQPLAQGNL